MGRKINKNLFLNEFGITLISKMPANRGAASPAGTNIINMNTTQGCSQDGMLSPVISCILEDELLDDLANTGVQRTRIPYLIEYNWNWGLLVGTSITLILFIRKLKLNHLIVNNLYGSKIKKKAEASRTDISTSRCCVSWKWKPVKSTFGGPLRTYPSSSQGEGSNIQNVQRYHEP